MAMPSAANGIRAMRISPVIANQRPTGRETPSVAPQM